MNISKVFELAAAANVEVKITAENWQKSCCNWTGISDDLKVGIISQFRWEEIIIAPMNCREAFVAALHELGHVHTMYPKYNPLEYKDDSGKYRRMVLEIESDAWLWTFDKLEEENDLQKEDLQLAVRCMNTFAAPWNVVIGDSYNEFMRRAIVNIL